MGNGENLNRSPEVDSSSGSLQEMLDRNFLQKSRKYKQWCYSTPLRDRVQIKVAQFWGLNENSWKPAKSVRAALEKASPGETWHDGKREGIAVRDVLSKVENPHLAIDRLSYLGFTIRGSDISNWGNTLLPSFNFFSTLSEASFRSRIDELSSYSILGGERKFFSENSVNAWKYLFQGNIKSEEEQGLQAAQHIAKLIEENFSPRTSKIHSQICFDLSDIFRNPNGWIRVATYLDELRSNDFDSFVRICAEKYPVSGILEAVKTGRMPGEKNTNGEHDPYERFTEGELATVSVSPLLSAQKYLPNTTFKSAPSKSIAVEVPAIPGEVDRYVLPNNFHRISSHHGRSMEFSPEESLIPFKIDGLPYSGISLKGAKFTDPRIEPDENFASGVRYHGLLTLDMVMRMVLVSKFFAEHGISAERAVQVYKYERLPYKGKFFSQAEFKILLLEDARERLKGNKNVNLRSVENELMRVDFVCLERAMPVSERLYDILRQTVDYETVIVDK